MVDQNTKLVQQVRLKIGHVIYEDDLTSKHDSTKRDL